MVQRRLPSKYSRQGTSEEDKVKFLQEAAIMAQFRHPHIVRLLGAVTLDEPVGVCGSVLVSKACLDCIC